MNNLERYASKCIFDAIKDEIRKSKTKNKFLNSYLLLKRREFDKEEIKGKNKQITKILEFLDSKGIDGLIVKLHFGIDGEQMSLREIGKKLNLMYRTVHYKEKKIIKELEEVVVF